MALKKENFDLLDIAKSQVVNFQKGWNKNARESALARLINMGLPNIGMNIGSIQIQAI